ncbi:hypothetical protein [Streptomyces sp. NPDC002845]
MNVPVLTDPFGGLLRACPALPGAPTLLTAAGTHGVLGALAEAGIKAYAGKGCQGAPCPVRVPLCGRRLRRWRRRRTTHARIRCVVGRAMATPERWRLPCTRCCGTTRITAIVQDVLTLHHTATS